MRSASASGSSACCARRGYDKRIWLHGGLLSLCKLYQEHGIDLGDVALVSDAILETFKGAIVLLPAFGDCRPLVAALRRSDRRGVLGLDGRARPRAPDAARNCR